MPRKDPRFNPKYQKNVAQKRDEENKIEGQEIGNNTILSQHLASGSVTPEKISNDWPAFYALSSGQNRTTVANTSLVFDGGVRYNIGGHYSTSTYRFLVPYDGLYYFWLGYYCNGGTDRMRLTIDGAGISQPYLCATAGSNVEYTGGFAVYLTKGNYIDVRAQYGNGTYYGGHTAWGGYLIR